MFDKWSDKLSVKKNINNISLIFKVLKFLKTFLLFSMIIVVFWGMGTMMADKSVAIISIGETGKEDFFSGVFFEISAGVPEKFRPNPKIIFNLENNILYQYNYNEVYFWSDMLKYVVCPFYIVFVWPVSWLFTKMCVLFGFDFNNMENEEKNIFIIIGSLFLITFLMRIINFYGSWKSMITQEKMKKLQPKINEIKKKNMKNNTNMASRQIEQREIMNLYKQHNVNPLSSLQAFAFMPFLSVIFIVVRSNYIIRATEISKGNDVFSFSKSIKQIIWDYGQWSNWRYYLIIFFYFSFLGLKFFIPWYSNRNNSKNVKKVVVDSSTKSFGGFEKGQIMKIMFQLFFIGIFFTIPTGASIYFTFGLFFEILQKLFFEILTKKKKQVAILRKKGIETNIWKQLFFTIKKK